MGTTRALPTALPPSIFVSEHLPHAEPLLHAHVAQALGHISPNTARYYDAYLQYGPLRRLLSRREANVFLRFRATAATPSFHG
jgi:hypothetical protein